jgi:hypothetical protein
MTKSPHHSRGSQIALTALIAVLIPLRTHAQIASASVNGTVRDGSGAVIPDVAVTIHNIDTNVDRTTSTNSQGQYNLVNIPPGPYRLRFNKQDFTTQETSLTLVVDQTATFDAKLNVGATTQTVSVEATAIHLEASTAELGTAITQKPINNLPLNGRNFTQLLALTPGASPANVSQNKQGVSRANVVGSYSFPAVNGQTNRSNYFLVNGLSDQEAAVSTYAVAPIVDDIQEFKVDSHNDQATFGGVTGGIINVITKSGTNAFHGTLWEFLRNEQFDARNPFFAGRNPLRQNQFGGNVGGPVVLPHYNGRNRTFFFASYEGLRRVEVAQTLYRVPTAPELQGDVSDLGVPIYNPFTTRPDPAKPGQYRRDPFVGSVIPANLLNAGSIAFAKALYPEPINTGVAGTNGVDNTPTRNFYNTYSYRIDQQIGTKDSAWFRLAHDSRHITGSDGFLGLASNTHVPAVQLAASWTHSFNSSAVLQLQFGHTSSENDSTSRFVNAPADLGSQVGFADGFACGMLSGGCLLPNASIQGFASGGESTSTARNTNLYEWRANASKSLRRHLLEGGIDFNTGHLPINLTEDLTVGFTAFETANPESTKGSGNALASFLLGVPNNAQRRNVNGPTEGGKEVGMYFQDQWKVTDKLTINMGLRWDISFLPRIADKIGYIGDLNLNDGTYVLQKAPRSCSETGAAPCLPGGVLPAHVLVSPDGKLLHTDFRDFQPRLGFAYRILPKTVIRTSYGRFYDNWAGIIQAAQNLRGQWPSLGIIRVSNLNAPTTGVGIPNSSFENPGIAGTALPPATPFTSVALFRDPYAKNPYSDQWQFGIQQALSTNSTLELDYVGSHSGHLDHGSYKNVSVTPGPGAPTLRSPYPYITPTRYDQFIGRSNYEALQFKVNGRANKGITYLVSYTYSKSIDTGCSGSFNEACDVETPYNLSNDRGVSGFDLTHVFSTSWVWDLPFGSGGRFRSGNRVLDAVIGRWAVNGIVSMTSGLPFTLNASGDIANIGDGDVYERPNLVGNPSLPNPNASQWFNTDAFQIPSAYTFGNFGRNTLRGQWFKNLDFSIFREFPIPLREGMHLQFRAEMFNATNTPTLGQPTTGIQSLNFGKILNTRSTEREIQFSLKFYF